MKFQNFAKLIPIFILGLLLIAAYRMFDNFGIIFEWGGRLLSILVPFIIGGIIAYLLLPPCRTFERLYSKSKMKFVNKARRPLSVVTVFLLAFAAIGILLRIVIPAIAQSIEEFLVQWPELYANFQAFVINLGFFEAYEVEQFFSDENMMELVTGFINMDNVMTDTQGIIGFSMAVFNVFIGFVVSIYILIDRKSLYRLIHKIAHLYIKPKILKPLVKYTRKINEFLYRYIYSQLLDSLIMGTMSFIALSIIDVTHAPVSALLLGIFNFIPYFGSIVATVIAILLALLSDGFNTAVIVTVVLLVLQQTDANFIQPRLAGAYLKVRPLWIILGILIAGGMGGGIWGMFIAPPIVAMIKIIINDIIEHREKRVGKVARPKSEEQDEKENEEKSEENSDE